MREISVEKETMLITTILSNSKLIICEQMVTNWDSGNKIKVDTYYM